MTDQKKPPRNDLLGAENPISILKDILDYNGAFPNLPGEIIERARRVVRAALVDKEGE